MGQTTYAAKQAQLNSGGRLLISVGSSIVSQGLVSSSGQFGYGGNGPIEWARVLTNQRFQYRNAGVSSQNSTQIRERFKRDVLQYKPAIIVLQNGTNEIGEGADAIFENTKAMADAGVRMGADVIICSTLPRGSASSWDADDQRTALGLNDRKRRYCENNPKLHFCDWSKFIIDPTSTSGEALSAMYRDGVHWSNSGAYRAGRALQPIIENILPPNDVVSPSYLNANGTTLTYGFETTNPTLIGTSGTNGTGSSGDVPDGFRAERINATGTVAGSFPTTTGYDPTRWYQQEFTPGTNTGEGFRLRTSSSNFTPASTDDYYEGVCLIEVDAWDGWEQIILEVDDQGTGNKTIYDMGDPYATVMPDTAWTGVLKTPPFKSDGDIRLRLATTIDGTASGTGTHRVANFGLRRVNPNYLPTIFDKYENGIDNKLT